jgi:MFS family permease
VTTNASRAAARPGIAFALIVSSTVLGLAGTDLVLPAVPSLPAALGGTPEEAQLVLAAFVGGSGLGLLLFGELGARFDQRNLLIASLASYGLLSLTCALAPSLTALVALRLLQGAAGSAAAVFAPGIIRALYADAAAIRALGLLGSIESAVPALAPLAGVWLLAAFGWQSSFWVTGVGAFAVAIAVALLRTRLPRTRLAEQRGGYLQLGTNPVYLRYALSHAFTLGALLVFVFGAPAVIVNSLGGTLTDFIILQIGGIAFFIFGANVASHLVTRFGAERTISGGTALSAFGAALILLYALAGGADPATLALLFVPMNFGLGLRGPPGFFRAVQASGDDDARGAALVILAILLTTALGTAAVAPLITLGLVPLAAAAAAISLSAIFTLLLLPRLPD